MNKSESIDGRRLLPGNSLPVRASFAPDEQIVDNLKAKTVRGGAMRTCAIGASFVLRIGSFMALSRFLGPRDFGLVGMVAAITSVLNMFRDLGLSSAAVQSARITEQQASTLFWINVLAGVILTVITVIASPLVAILYHEPRLLWITSCMALSFLFNGAGVQHWARLQRQMNFTALTIIEIVALVLSTLLAVAAALAGFGYWSLVAMTVSSPLIVTVAAWVTTAWVPTMWPRSSSVRSMMRFGGTLTLNGLVLQLTFNLDKVLLGRFWGADSIGLYSRAYQLIRIPTDGMNQALGQVAFSALSRIQEDLTRFRRYFLWGYSLVLAVTVPVTIASSVFADDVVFVLLGPKWREAGPIVRLLAPTILAFAIANPMGWLMNALGLAKRSLAISLVLAPLMTAGYLIGLRGGPKGVALAYSVVMILWIMPVTAWAVHGTAISFSDMLLSVSRPLGSVLAALAITLALRPFYDHGLRPWPRLSVNCAILFIFYSAILLFGTGQKSMFLDIIRAWKGNAAFRQAPCHPHLEECLNGRADPNAN